MLASEIMYNSGVHIDNMKDLATLSVFYDKVWLPNLSNSIAMVKIEERPPERWKLDLVAVQMSLTDRDGKLWGPVQQNGRVIPGNVRFTKDWDERNKVLFEAGVIRRLPPPIVKPFIWLDDPETSDVIGKLELFSDYIHGFMAPYEGGREIYLWEDHLSHLLRNDQQKPAVFLPTDQSARRQVANTALAESIMSYCLPQLGDLLPSEIMEVRRITNDNREGFMAHLQSLSAALDSLLRGGAKREELEGAAFDVVQTKLIPDYVEFKRQLGAARVGKIKRILDPASKILEINSSPWAPKFWYDLFHALYLSATGAVDNKKDNKTNKSLAFNFIRKLEERNVGRYRL